MSILLGPRSARRALQHQYLADVTWSATPLHQAEAFLHIHVHIYIMFRVVADGPDCHRAQPQQGRQQSPRHPDRGLRLVKTNTYIDNIKKDNITKYKTYNIHNIVNINIKTDNLKKWP